MRQVTKSTTPRGTRVGKFRSTFESRIAKDLEERGVGFGYENLKLTYQVKSKKYTPDFTIERKGLPRLIVEVKGWFQSKDRTKLLNVGASNPTADIRLVFQRASTPIFKGSTTTYAMWAEQHGFPWAERTVPEAWLKQ